MIPSSYSSSQPVISSHFIPIFCDNLPFISSHIVFCFSTLLLVPQFSGFAPGIYLWTFFQNCSIYSGISDARSEFLKFFHPSRCHSTANNFIFNIYYILVLLSVFLILFSKNLLVIHSFSLCGIFALLNSCCFISKYFHPKTGLFQSSSQF